MPHGRWLSRPFLHVSNRYADFRPHYPAAIFDYLATLVPKNSFVWDCAAGTGQAAVDLAERFDKIIATDASKEQIAAATPHPKIEYRVALAEGSGLPDACVGLITVAQAAHWFDLNEFYPEVRRVLTPGGVLAVWAYGINEVEGKAVNELVQDFYSNVVGPYWPPERKLLEEGYGNIPFPFAEIPSPAFRMEARWTLDQLLGYFSTWSATNRFIKATGRNPLEPLCTARRFFIRCQQISFERPPTIKSIPPWPPSCVGMGSNLRGGRALWDFLETDFQACQQGAHGFKETFPG